jgi:thiol:disulfide interchange protein/DsbC/DsbD-like thiol-disulfide interchange protein
MYFNRFKQRVIKYLLYLFVFTAIPSYAEITHIRVNLLSENTSIEPGQPFWIGVHFTMNPDWNIYWLNPGEIGLATEIKWQLPKGFTASNLHWPYPSAIAMDNIVGYGYEGETILLTQIMAPPTLERNSTVLIKAYVEWLECNDLCLPGAQELQLELPVAQQFAQLDDKTHQLFEKTRKQLPYLSKDWEVRVYTTDEEIDFLIEKIPGSNVKLPTAVYFFSYINDVHSGSLQKLETYGQGLLLRVQRNPYYSSDIELVQGLLFSEQGWDPTQEHKALEVNLYVQEDNLPPPLRVSTQKIDAIPPSPPLVQSNSISHLSTALIFAFLGGLILNLMPCVFPVLGLKILNFVAHAKDSKKIIRLHGFIFTAGIVLSFWLLSGVLMLLRATGEELGWGFQLQSPGFVAFLIVLLFVLALNFIGVFEIGESIMGIGSQLSQKQGYLGSFFSGVLATIVATPCTISFMATALAFALSQPAFIAFLVFTTLALGMAFPYIILSFNPSLLKLLPKPGAWMETFKIVMAFPLFATVIWLSWVFSLQVGYNAQAELLFALLIIALGLWIYSRFKIHGRNKSIKATAKIICLTCFGLGVMLAYDAQNKEIRDMEIIMSSNTLDPINTPSITSDEIAWMPYSFKLIEELKAQGQPIYVDFTAAWCLTCQANKKAIFNSEKVIKRLKELNIAMVRADWTRRDPAITQALQAFGRSGVPLNVIYPPQQSGLTPIILPSILTPNIVLEKLDEIADSRCLVK